MNNKTTITSFPEILCVDGSSLLFSLINTLMPPLLLWNLLGAQHWKGKKEDELFKKKSSLFWRSWRRGINKQDNNKLLLLLLLRPRRHDFMMAKHIFLSFFSIHRKEELKQANTSWFDEDELSPVGWHLDRRWGGFFFLTRIKNKAFLFPCNTMLLPTW